MGRSIGRSRFRRNRSKNKKENKKRDTKQNVSKVSRKKPKTTTTSNIECLNDHCLIKIFEILSINDLVNVSVTSSRFKLSTCIVFGQKFAKNVINISNEVLPYQKNSHHLTAFLLLRNFGHLIKKLKVNYKEDYNRFNREFENAIIKYTTKSVTEIEFFKADKFAFAQIKRRQFKAVTKVVFANCVVGRFMFEISKWFPNAQRLELLESTMLAATDAACIEQEFPRLAHLAIINPKQQSEDMAEFEENVDFIIRTIFSNVNLKAVIELNPQLKSLKLRHNNSNAELQNFADHCGIKITQNFLAYINDKLPQLDELHIFVSQNGEDGIAHPHVCFKSVRKIRFVVSDVHTLKNYAISTQQPAKLIITARDRLNDSCAVFLSKNKMWRKIVLNGDWESYQSFECIKVCLLKFPILSSIKISVNGPITGKENQVLSLLNECKFLNKLKICYSIAPWHNLAMIYDLDSDDKRRAEIKFLDSVKFWNDWIQYLSEIDPDIDIDNVIVTQGIRNRLPEWLEKRGLFTVEMYRISFESKRFSLWQSTYYKQDRYFFAKFEKKN